MNPLNAQNIATATTTTVKTGRGILGSIIVNTTAAGTITVYDSATATGTKLATFKASVVEGTYTFNCFFLTGLTVVTGGASDITVTYQ